MRRPTADTAEAGRTTPCCTKVGLKRGPWTPEEDELLANYIKKEGGGRWRTLPKRAGLLRCGKSCRLRWMNYLRPSVKRGQIAPDEEDLILRLHRLLGNRWSLIAGRIPGRTDNEIKNYWNTHLSKKLVSQGIDPRTHKPLNPNQLPSHLKASSSSSSKVNPGASTATIPNPNVKPAASSSSGAGKENEYVQNHHQTENQGVIRSNEEDDEDINNCNDDVFSSFLNSLINEDAFASQNPLQQLTNGIAQADALVSITASTFSLAQQDWNFNQNDHERVNDHLN
ncbi:hypothetical protein V6N13_140601 [Hibiscus sabdariffa]|uniref:Uncharacterized protein n=2 Tax=Hibiscus sabdariffa TaxID=183260 RepID=A0ABR2BL08_9ROSI